MLGNALTFVDTYCNINDDLFYQREQIAFLKQRRQRFGNRVFVSIGRSTTWRARNEYLVTEPRAEGRSSDLEGTNHNASRARGNIPFFRPIGSVYSAYQLQTALRNKSGKPVIEWRHLTKEGDMLIAYDIRLGQQKRVRATNIATMSERNLRDSCQEADRRRQ